MSSFGAVTATSALTQLLPANTSRKAVLIKSLSTNAATVFLGLIGSATTLTLQNGMPISAGESLYIATDFGNVRAADWGDAIGIITGTDGQSIRFIEFT